MKIKIRRIKKTDVQRVHELVYELAVYEKEPHQVTNTIEMMVKDGFGKNKIFGCFVAEVDGFIQGFQYIIIVIQLGKVSVCTLKIL